MNYSQALRCARLWTPISSPTSKRTLLATVHRAQSYHAASVLPSLVSPPSPEFQARANAMNQVVADLETKLAAAREGGGTKAAERMRSRGKKLPRERCWFFISAVLFG